ncbi:ELMO domain-containing protein 3-like [Liolophura sinensis]|uniref:ELMO domain-containing protein 3-like n=1 Tax=Liolophura sinensis TaxID=3198878 RepID=UPI0031588934
MALTLDVADTDDFCQSDPLNLEEINFSCVTGGNEVDDDEFDCGDNIFQKVEEPVQGNVISEKNKCVLNPNCQIDPVGERLYTELQPEEGKADVHCEQIVNPRKDIIAGEHRIIDETQSTDVDQVGVDFGSHNGDDSQPDCVPSELIAAQAEWDQVQCIEAGYADPSHPGQTKEINTSAITFSEALQHFQTSDLNHLKPEITTSVHRTGFSALRHFLFGPPALNKELLTEKEMAFCIAASEFDNKSDVHTRVLQTIYRTLTGSKFDCPRYGSHFEEIGFQGNDPATDLRGGGFLGLMHILHLLTDQQTLPLARNIYKLSMDETQNFPFCLMGINISRITLQAAREGCLNKECNRRKQVVAVMNDFYVGTYLHLYEIWKYQHKTIGDSGFVLKDVEFFAKKNPKCILKKLDTYLAKQKQNSGASSSFTGSGDKVAIDKLT